MINRKAQEEMVGFVLIIVIVAVVLLVFLGITIRSSSTQTTSESTDVYQFLESSMEVTSECATRFVPDYSTIGELFRECYNGNSCLNGKEACEILQENMDSILQASWNIGNESSIKGYDLKATFSTNSSSAGEEIISILEGNCDNSLRGASYLIPSFPGRISVNLNLCF